METRRMHHCADPLGYSFGCLQHPVHYVCHWPQNKCAHSYQRYARAKFVCSSSRRDAKYQPKIDKLAAGSTSGNGVHFLLLANVLVFLADHVVHVPGLRSALYLNHLHPRWWQFFTHQFCHASIQHLGSNMFQLLVFGKMVEETEGATGLVLFYLATGLGAAAATFLLSPPLVKGHINVSLGASGAIFGLFVVSVLGRLVSGFNLRRLLEAAVLGNFVVGQVMNELKSQVTGEAMIGGLQVSHVAHIGGALAGILLVLALQRLPHGEPTDVN